MKIDNHRLQQGLDGLIIRLGLTPIGGFVWCVPMGHKKPKKCRVQAYDFGTRDDDPGRFTYGVVEVYNPRNKWIDTLGINKIFPSKEACEASMAEEGE